MVNATSKNSLFLATITTWIVVLVRSSTTMLPKQWFAFVSKRNHLGGVNDAWIVTSESIARGNSDVSPYLIPNEWICGNLAWFLRLPIPPFALVRKSSTQKGMFASLKFGTSDSTPDDARPERCVQSLPDLCTGILLFDVLVANGDRHVGNIKVDDPFQPSLMHVFDHDRALLGCVAKGGRRRLGHMLTRMGILGGSGSFGGEQRHCFIDELNTAAHFGKWLERIRQIPDWFVGEICRQVRGLGVTQLEAEAAMSFLRHRKTQIRSLVTSNKAAFSGVRNWGLFI
jgi:hypothetical protein